MRALLDYAEKNTHEIIETLRGLVVRESFSADKAAVDLLGAHIASLLTDIGAHVEIVPQSERGDHLLAQWGQGADQVLVLCHMDTVWPTGTIRSRPFRVADEVAYGPGVLDMKAGIAITLHALKAMQALGVRPKGRVRMLFNSDEEVGSPTSRPVIEEEARRSSHVFCLEPAYGKEGALKTARKGVGIFDVKIAGRAAHAGNDPWNGISAVTELAHQVLRLNALTNYHTGTTVNVGVVKAGAVRNQVAASAEAQVDLRVATMEEAEKATKAILGLSSVLPGASITVTGGLNRPPMERSEGTLWLFNAARKVAAGLGTELQEAHVGGGSDAQFAAAVNTPVLDGLGGVGEGPHADSEYVVVQSLPQRVALLASLLAGEGL